MKGDMEMQYLDDFMPLIVMVTGGVLSSAGIVIAAIFKKRYGIELEVADRSALHSAMKTGIESAIARSGNSIKDERELEHPLGQQKVMKEAIDYAKKSVPEALGRLQPGADILANIAISKLQEALKRN